MQFTLQQFSHIVLCTTALVQLILTCLLVKDDIFAEQVVVAQNYRGAQHRQVLLEPQQLFSEAPWAGHLCSQPARGNGKMERGEIKREKKAGEVNGCTQP